MGHDLLEPLKRVWGYDALRPLQEQAVRAALSGQDALVVLPTGGGKSLCFQLPPLIDKGLTLVISPLISLMTDQLDGLRQVGYPADAWHSGMSVGEAEGITNRLVTGETRLLYISPERLLMPSMRPILAKANQGKGIARVAIDEAHCISQWGHDFRPNFRQLSQIRNLVPGASIHALTATATPRVREDIIAQLSLREPEVLIGSFDRPNLTYRVVPKVRPVDQIADAVARHPEDAAIVYCLSRKDTETVAGALQARGISAKAYHAGLGSDERRQISEDFAQDRLRVVVATVAFGMGIDRSNVRVVVHDTLPSSIEAYQQETGRAGRDGLPSECLMLYDPGDIVRWERMLRDSPDASMVGQRLKLISEVRKYATSTTCRHQFLCEYFGQAYDAQEGGCDACDLCLEGWKAVENGTKHAHRILGLVRELNRMSPDFGYGAVHVAGILAGSDTAAIRGRGHQDLRAYGCIKGIPAPVIAGWVNQVVDMGYLERQGDKFPSLWITEAGALALDSRLEIALRDLAIPVKSKRRAGTANAGPLFEALRVMRKEIATARGVPPYVVFHDSVLLEIAAKQPKTLSELRAISGMGDRRAADHGERVLGVVSQYLGTPAPVISEEPEPEKPMTARRSERLDSVASALRANTPLAELAKRLGVTMATVTNYATDLIVDARPESISAWVDDTTYQRVATELTKDGTGRLAPVHAALNGEVDYDTIRLVKAHLATRTESEGPE